jgi:hypothetical protein
MGVQDYADRRERLSMPNIHQPGMNGDLQLQDCRIWAEIDYLDSPTDYRECLPGAQTPPLAADDSDPVLLDARFPHSRKPTARSRPFGLGLIFTLINILILAYILYQFVEAM